MPLYAAEHFYLVTKAIAGVSSDMPVIRDPDGYLYYKEEVGGLVMGGFEPKAKPWNVDPIPDGFEFQLLPEDWDHFEILMQNAIHRTPCLETAEVKLLLNGPEASRSTATSSSAKRRSSPAIFVCAGFNSAGIANAGGAGKLVAEWIVNGDARARPVGCRHAALRAVPRQSPAPRRPHGRDARPALRDALAARGARDRPAAAALAALRSARRKARRVRQQDELGARELLPARRARTSHHIRWARPAGCRMCWKSSARAARTWSCSIRRRSRSSCSKVATRLRCCSATCANEIDVPVGRMVYTGMLNARGGFESDLTVVRLGLDEFFIITGSAQTTRDFAWIERAIRDDEHAALVDVTSAYSVISVMGPKAEALLGRVSPDDLSKAGMPFATTRMIDVGYARVRAARDELRRRTGLRALRAHRPMRDALRRAVGAAAPNSA